MTQERPIYPKDGLVYTKALSEAIEEFIAWDTSGPERFLHPLFFPSTDSNVVHDDSRNERLYAP